ncbi:MAG: alpha/beta hydrolase [Allosphingosinicella sp.]
MVWKLLLAAVLVYGAICAFAFLFQDRALFAVDAARAGGPLPPGAERLALAAADGTRLVGLHVPPRRPSSGAGSNPPLILGFGGNAWNADHAAEYLGDVYPGADIVTFHYRGYAPSGGRPGAAALLADSLTIHDFAAARWPGRPIVAIGFSIGSGIAAHLARERPVAGAILVTPFDSLTKVAAGHFRWLPVRWLFRNRMDAAEDLAMARAPVAILAGGADTLIPKARTDGLRHAARTLVYDRTVAGAGHNDIYARSEFQQDLREALAAVIARRS